MAFMVVSLTVPMDSSLTKPVDFLFINAVSPKENMEAEKGQEGRFLSLSSLSFMIKAMS